MSDPIFPCMCGHVLAAHGEIDESWGGWDYDSEGNEVWREDRCQPRPICSECGDCYFQEMTNLEFLEWKDDNHQRI